jgi:hypothetical protein
MCDGPGEDLRSRAMGQTSESSNDCHFCEDWPKEQHCGFLILGTALCEF